MTEPRTNGTHMEWPPLIPPQPMQATPAAEEPGQPSPGRLLLFSNLWAWWRNARERKMKVQIARLKVKLAAAEEERDRLAEINENLRQWVLASTATAANVAAMLGGGHKEPLPPPKRTGAYG